MDSTEEDRMMARIEKLLRLANNNPNEHEASSALQMAQQLADAWNIDIAQMGGKSTKTGSRTDQKFGGGLYPYQRTLYKAIAELNHCMYWHEKGLQRGEKYRHRLLGSALNVKLARQMAEYLQGAVESITRQDFCHGIANNYFKKDAHVFREGMVDRIVQTIQQKRYDDAKEQARKREEEMARAGPTGNSIVIIDDVVMREYAANYDHLYGEGAYAAREAREAEHKAAREKARQDYEQWCKDNPEEYAKALEAEAARQRKYAKEEAKRAARRKAPTYSRKPTKYDSDAYWQGQNAGAKVRLDPQVEKAETAGALE